MKTITKILTIATMLGLAACSQSKPAAPVGSGDVYVLLFVAHTSQQVPPEQASGIAIRPHTFITLDACNKAKADLEASFSTEEGQAWFKNSQIDKKAVVCTPVSF